MFRTKLVKIARLMSGLAATAAGLVGLAGENDLYSEVQTGSVFTTGNSSKDTDSPETPRIDRRLTSLEQLSQLVRDAGFEPKTAEGRSVTTTKTLEPWLFPVSVSLSDDELQLQVSVGLGAVADKQKVDAGKILALLEANKLKLNAKFGFNAVGNRTELLAQIRNDGVTAELFRDEINRLTLMAKESESLWQIEPARTLSRTELISTVPAAAVRVEATPPVAAPADTSDPAAVGNSAVTANPGNTTPTAGGANPATSVATPSDSSSANSTVVQSSAFTGRWSASRASNEAFAILFDANGSFVLVSIKDGKQAKSSGKFTVVGTQLTLEGTDGVRLSGAITMKSATEFSFQPASAIGTIAAFNFRKSP